MAKSKSPIKTGGKQGRDEKGRWCPGVSGNPKGKPLGARHFKADFELAAKEVAEALRLGKEPDKIKIELIKRGIKEGLAGKFPFWKEIIERLFGKPKEEIDVTATGKPLSILHNLRKKENLLDKKN